MSSALSSVGRPSRAALLVAGLLAAGLLGGAGWLARAPGPGATLAFSLLAGGLFGLLLQRSRFCFFCITNDYLQHRDPRGLLGLLTALAVGTLGYHAVFGAFLPDPGAGRLPPDAHVGPVSWVLAAGSVSFGLGMALSGSCLSAHLYRLGEGAVASTLALAGAAIGFALGFLSWNSLYLLAIQQGPVLWLPASLGYGGSLMLQLAWLGALAWALIHFARPQTTTPAATFGEAIFRRRWPPYLGGALIGALGVVAYFRVAPLGVTAELGSLSRTAADALHLLPARLEGLDGFAGCVTQVKDSLLSHNGLFVIALVLASLASALTGGDFRLQKPSGRDLWRHFLGGILMGWGAMVALGCTVGTLLSGIMAGAVSGWVFALFCLLGMLAGRPLRRRLFDA